MNNLDLTGSEYVRLNILINALCSIRIEHPYEFQRRHNLQELLVDLCWRYLPKDDRPTTDSMLNHLKEEMLKKNKLRSHFRFFSNRFERELIEFAQKQIKED